MSAFHFIEGDPRRDLIGYHREKVLKKMSKIHPKAHEDFQNQIEKEKNIRDPKKKLSSELADIVGTSEASRAEVIKLMLEYIKQNNLKDPSDSRYFIPDEKMAKILPSYMKQSFRIPKHMIYSSGPRPKLLDD